MYNVESISHHEESISHHVESISTSIEHQTTEFLVTFQPARFVQPTACPLDFVPVTLHHLYITSKDLRPPLIGRRHTFTVTIGTASTLDCDILVFVTLRYLQYATSFDFTSTPIITFFLPEW
jgi:hypothetical protein